MSDWRLSGDDIDSLRLWYSQGRGYLGVRSPQAGIEAAAMFERIVRPDSLRCGPIYVPSPKHDGSGYELTDEHVRALKQIDRATGIVAALLAHEPHALTVLQLVYLHQPAPGLNAFDTETGDHAARISNLVAHSAERLEREEQAPLQSVGRIYAGMPEPKPSVGYWLTRLSHRVFFGRGTQAGVAAEDSAAVAEIGNEATAKLAAASREWRAAKMGVRRG